MNKIIKTTAVGLYVTCLSSCTMMNEENEPYLAYTYDAPAYSQIYPTDNLRAQPIKRPVEVPETYHVGPYHSPVSFKARDQAWVTGQNPQSYTIEVAEDVKAAQVARKLHSAPKSDRVAQIEYERNGQTYYKGVYGSFDTMESATKALDNLPTEVKQGAAVKKWESIQNRI